MRIPPILELLFAIAILSFTGIFAKIIPWPAVVIIFWRSAIAGILLFGYLMWRSRFSLRVSWIDFFGIFLVGVLMMAHWVTYYMSLKWSTVAIGMISLHAYPVISALIEPFFTREKFLVSDVLAACIVLVGIVIMAPRLSWQDASFSGAMMGVFSAFLLSIRNIFTRIYIKKYSGEVLMFYQMVAAIVLIPFLFLFPMSTSPLDWKNLLLLAVFCTAIGHTLWVRNLAHFKVSTAGTVSCLGPVIGSLVAIRFLGELPTFRIFLGGAIILLTALYEVRRHAKRC